MLSNLARQLSGSADSNGEMKTSKINNKAYHTSRLVLLLSSSMSGDRAGAQMKTRQQPVKRWPHSDPNSSELHNKKCHQNSSSCSAEPAKSGEAGWFSTSLALFLRVEQQNPAPFREALLPAPTTQVLWAVYDGAWLCCASGLLRGASPRHSPSAGSTHGSRTPVPTPGSTRGATTGDRCQ